MGGSLEKVACENNASAEEDRWVRQNLKERHRQREGFTYADN